VPGSLCGLAAWTAETVGSEPGMVARMRAGLRRRHQDAYLSGKHSNRLVLLLGNSRTAAGTPETGSDVLASDLNPHEQNPAPGPSQAEARPRCSAGTAAHRGHDRAASWPTQVALCDPLSLARAHVYPPFGAATAAFADLRGAYS
jgi:hypothetical protein